MDYPELNDQSFIFWDGGRFAGERLNGVYPEFSRTPIIVSGGATTPTMTIGEKCAARLLAQESNTEARTKRRPEGSTSQRVADAAITEGRTMMGHLSRLIVISILSAACSFQAAQAQTDFPSKPIRIIVATAAAGASDTVTRLLAEKAEQILGQRIVVENRPGGGSVIGAQLVARSEPDGYTILAFYNAQSVITHLQPVSYSFEKDFAPVINVGFLPQVLVVPGRSDIRSIPDLAAVAKTMKDGANYGSGGTGTMGHLGAALLAGEVKFESTHVLYKGNSPAIQDVVAGRLQYMFPTVLEVAPFVKSGDLRALAVTSGARVPILPDVPTMKELGYGHIDPRVEYGFLVPANTPQVVIDKLYKAFETALKDPGVQERLGAVSFSNNILAGPAFAEFIRNDSARWKKVIVDNKIKLEVN